MAFSAVPRQRLSLEYGFSSRKSHWRSSLTERKYVETHLQLVEKGKPIVRQSCTARCARHVENLKGKEKIVKAQGILRGTQEYGGKWKRGNEKADHNPPISAYLSITWLTEALSHVLLPWVRYPSPAWPPKDDFNEKPGVKVHCWLAVISEISKYRNSMLW